MKVLVIGFGNIGQRHAKNLLALGHAVILFDSRGGEAFLTHDLAPPNRISLAHTLNVGLADKPDAILIATPPETHLEMATRCLRPHIPLFIEKPLATDPIRAFDFLRDASRQYVPVAVGYQMRAWPSRQTMKRFIDNGTYGKIYAAHAEFAYSMDLWRKTPATYSAGIIVEASHELDQLCWMLGTPFRVIAAADTDDEHERLGLGVIEFESGARATFLLDGHAPAYRRGLTIYGKQMTATDGFNGDENDRAYIEELRAWLDGKPYCMGRDALTTVRLLDAIVRSRLTGSWVKVLA